jgi:hypothetical protein
LLLPCNILRNEKPNADVNSLLDSGATAETCIHPLHAQELELEKLTLKKPLQILGYQENGPREKVTHAVKVPMLVGNHYSEETALLVNTGTHKMILGKRWLNKHNPTIDWEKNSIEFDKPQCVQNHNLNHEPCKVYMRGFEPQSAVQADERRELELVGVQPSEKESPDSDSGSDQRNRKEMKTLERERKKKSKEAQVDLQVISAEALRRHGKRKGAETILFMPDLRPQLFFRHIDINSMSPEDIEIFMKKKQDPDPKTKLPESYHEYVDVFSRKEA